MKIQVLSPEIGLPNEKMNHDYWVRAATNRAILELGHEALDPRTREVPDIQIVFSGMDLKGVYSTRTGKSGSYRYNGKFKVVWAYSRPNEMKNRIPFLRQFDQIYCLTDFHTKIFCEETGLSAKPLRIGTDKMYTPAQSAYAFDVAYMGSSAAHRREPIKHLADKGVKVVVAGFRWNTMKHPNIHVVGQFWPNDQFGKFYNQAPMSIYPQTPSFVRYGIVPIRIMDIYASSDNLCISGANPGLMETFAITPPQYDSVSRLLELIDFFKKNPAERQSRQRTIRESINRTYKDLVLDIIVDAMDFWSKK